MTALARKPAPAPYVFAQSPCGGLEMEVMGAALRMRASGALFDLAHQA